MQHTHVLIRVKKVGNDDRDGWPEDVRLSWFEEMGFDFVNDAEALGEVIIQYFNDTLNPHETARELVSAKFITKEPEE